MNAQRRDVSLFLRRAFVEAAADYISTHRKCRGVQVRRWTEVPAPIKDPIYAMANDMVEYVMGFIEGRGVNSMYALNVDDMAHLYELIDDRVAEYCALR
jgi:hypothetical protein